MLALGIDIGTSGIRSAVLCGDDLIAQATAPHRPNTSTTIDANDWWAAVQDCLTQQVKTLQNAGHDPSQISAIAVDGTSGSMVLTDNNLAPVSPALMYNSKGFDAEAQVISSLVSGDHVAKGSNSALARAMRLTTLATQTPAHVMHQADFIASKLMGHPGGSDYNNALKTGFDPATESWPDWIAGAIDPTLLPHVVSPGTQIGTISAAIAAQFGLSTHTRIHAGTTDSIAAFLAAAPMAAGNAVTSLGSTLAIKLLSPTRIDDPKIGLYSHRVGDHWLVGGASNTGGAVLKAHFNDAELAALSAQIDPSHPSDLDYYPLLEPGERFPTNDPNFEPRLTPRPAGNVAFLHGMLDGIARIEAACYREITSRGGRVPDQVFTAGGGAKNPTWSAIRATHLGLVPTQARHSDAAYGVAKLAQISV